MSKTTPQNKPANNRQWFAFRNATESEVEVYLYDEIGFWGTGAKEFISELRQHAGKHVHLRINSPGGEVIEGTAILNALKRHAGGVTVHIDALAASMASVIAMAGNPVFIADNALLMIHDPYTFAGGTSEELRKSADLLDAMKNNLVRSYVSKTGLSESEIETMMREETWLGATEAVALGFADAIEDGVQAAASMSPEKARARFDMLKKAMAEITDPNPETPDAPEVPVVETPETEPEEPTTQEAEQPAAPAARLDASALMDRINTVAAENASLRSALANAIADVSAARAEVVAARAEIAKVSDLLDKLEQSKGLASATVAPEVTPEAKALTKDQFDQLSPYAKAEFFRNGGKLS